MHSPFRPTISRTYRSSRSVAEAIQHWWRIRGWTSGRTGRSGDALTPPAERLAHDGEFFFAPPDTDTEVNPASGQYGGGSHGSGCQVRITHRGDVDGRRESEAEEPPELERRHHTRVRLLGERLPSASAVIGVRIPRRNLFDVHYVIAECQTVVTELVGYGRQFQNVPGTQEYGTDVILHTSASFLHRPPRLRFIRFKRDHIDRFIATYRPLLGAYLDP
jgi:hypothetical protein